MKRLLLLTLLLLSTPLVAQEKYRTFDDKIEAEAERLANAYDNELALTPQEYILFKKELERNLFKRAKIESKYKGKEMLDQLVVMRQYELSAMGDILTRIQLERYKELRPVLQPLATIQH